MTPARFLPSTAWITSPTWRVRVRVGLGIGLGLGVELGIGFGFGLGWGRSWNHVTRLELAEA